MLGARLICVLKQEARRFVGAQGGNIAVLFAVCLVLILCFVGAAIDYSRAVLARTQMQAALDSTALMLSKDVSAGRIIPAEISSKVQPYFTALYTNKEAQGVTVSAAYSQGGGMGGFTIVANGSGSIDTTFMGIAGFPTMSFSASSTVTSGSDKLRVALVLDNTGSMQDYGKIGALHSAAKAFVSQLSKLAENNGDVYISVVPFEMDVNVGTANVGASWLRWDDWDPSMFEWRNYSWCSDQGWSGTLAQCVGHGNIWQHSPNRSDHSRWNGCVTDRDQDYDVTSAPPTDRHTRFIADQDPDCPVAAILPLSSNWGLINSTIDSMSPSGATNQTIGLQWGWFSLLRQSPLNAPSEQAGSQYQHIIVLFTDGLNTGDRWYGDYSDQSPDVDTRMRMLCSNINASGVTIYTIQIDTDGAGPSAVLPDCASGSGNFFMLTQASQIASAFGQIAAQISKLRISK